ncbi:MAG TPA: metallopeptidase TldD-related protein, partial [Terriglobia bacterium]|nr:metallopeptidase TldD-related protein [Terriglobia bacterium]
MQSNRPSDSGWPRTFTSGPDTFVIYQPQVDKWDGNRIDLYSAVEFKAGKDSPAKYGVVWFQARTEVDKLNRLVTLDQAQLTKVRFPVAPDKGPELTVLIQKKLPGATKTMSLDRLEAALEANDDAVNAVDVKNDPPKVIITPKASLLVLIDGMAQLCEIEGTKLGRLINTRAVLLFENDKKNYYLRVQDWWLQAKDLEGPWFYAKKLPDDMKKAEEYVVSHTQAQTLEGEQQPSLKEAGKKAEIPVAYVVFGPTELIETKGEPQYKPIPGTGLEYAENTNGKFVFSASEAYLIENGAITSPLKNATLIGNGPDVLTKVSMVGNDLQLDEGIGTCGKDGQSVPVGVGIPT